MKIREAIKRADELRPNTAEDSIKYSLIYGLEGNIAEMMGMPAPENKWPDDAELLMPYPYDNVYELYLTAMLDYYNMDTELYGNDMALFTAAFNEAKAFWRRNNRADDSGSWNVM